MSRRALGVVGAVAAVVGAAAVVVGWPRTLKPRVTPVEETVASSEVRLPRALPWLPIREPAEAPVAAAISAPEDEEDQASQRAREQVHEQARVATEVDQLTKAVGLSDNQRLRAATIVKVVEHTRSMIARQPDPEARHEREKQLDQQAQLALLAVVSNEQAPLVASYFQSR